jgi:hypothetical protein
MAYKLNGKTLPLDRGFTHNEIQYPSNWLRLASQEDKDAIGITWEADPVRADDRFYWNGDVNNPKALEDKLETKEDGTPLYVQELDNSDPDNPVMVDTDEQVVTHGLKHVHTQQVKHTAGTLLNPTDWYYVRNAEVGTEVPAKIVSYRAAVRIECDRLEAAIAAVTTVEDLINILNGTNWPEL